MKTLQLLHEALPVIPELNVSIVTGCSNENVDRAELYEHDSLPHGASTNTR
jgi:hypothetical protein